jgi:catechol 2,3-dioxygenase-like lactoylglutathione lyase family enzyme
MAKKKKKGKRTAAKIVRKAASKRTAARRMAAKPARAKSADRAGLRISVAAPSFTVSDVNKSLAWYRDVLGFTAKERWEDGGTLQGVEMAAGPVSFMLGQDDWKRGRDRVKGEGFRIYCTTTQDVDGIAAGIKARGGTLSYEPRDEWGMRAFAIEDPDGFKITISSKKW